MKRDPDADLKVCAAATAGPWYDDKDGYRPGIVTSPVAQPHSVWIADDVCRRSNRVFIVEARDGWEAYIKAYEIMRAALEAIARGDYAGRGNLGAAHDALAEVDEL